MATSQFLRGGREATHVCALFSLSSCRKNPGCPLAKWGKEKTILILGKKKPKVHLKKTLVVVIGTNVGVVSPWVIIFSPNDI